MGIMVKVFNKSALAAEWRKIICFSNATVPSNEGVPTCYGQEDSPSL